MAIDFSTFFRHNIKEQGGKVPAARCRRRVRTPMPLRGACGCWHRQALVGRQSHYCIVKAESPFTRRTTSAGGKVPLPGARSTPFGVARAARCRRRVRTPMPLRGACGCWHRQALVGRQSHYCIVKAESPFTRRTTSAGGKVPLPGARSTPFGVARRLALAGIGWSPRPLTRYIGNATSPFTRRTTSAVSAANECEGITCGSK